MSWPELQGLMRLRVLKRALKSNFWIGGVVLSGEGSVLPGPAYEIDRS